MNVRNTMKIYPLHFPEDSYGSTSRSHSKIQDSFSLIGINELGKEHINFLSKAPQDSKPLVFLSKGLPSELDLRVTKVVSKFAHQLYLKKLEDQLQENFRSLISSLKKS